MTISSNLRIFLTIYLSVLDGDETDHNASIDEVMHYSSHHYKRLNVKPGITGEWQANGRSSVKDFGDIVCMDLDYQSKWSIAYDLSLIVKTLKVVLNKSGAC